MTNKKKFIIALLIALCIKLAFFVFAELYSPSTKFAFDTIIYDETAKNLVLHGEFARKSPEGIFSPELLRTPGYPAFLGVLHYLWKIPFSGVVFIQILITILVAIITYKTAVKINPDLAHLSSLIVLFDPPVTIFSSLLLTETLFLFLISLFMFMFISYLRDKNIKFIILSAIFVTMATYVRPVSYFLGIAVGIFMLYLFIRTRSKRVMLHAFIFLIIVYSFIGLWHLRNSRITGRKTFTTMTELAPWYRKNIRNDDAITCSLPPVLYYLNAGSRCTLSLMTNPGTLKDFNFGIFKKVAKIIFYLWMIFWFAGFLLGVSKIKKGDLCLQFLLFIVLYFISASVGGILFGVSSRMRVPMVPFIAILSASGWLWLKKNRREEL
ncbi:MAG: glycosyltransferase family 39 protein [Candidatus Omnitrophica bacterium]|nr:glycosyltransferase family 39 protein [Candidatus Omnitrophota bacterium]